MIPPSTSATAASSPFASPRTIPYVCAALVTAGFLAIGLSWSGAADLLLVPLQTPYAVSGGVAGLALIVVGVGIGYVHTGRVAAAEEIAAIDDLNRALSRVGIGVVLKAGTTSPALASASASASAEPNRASSRGRTRASARIAARRAERAARRRANGSNDRTN